jgi:hypothetical protein
VKPFTGGTVAAVKKSGMLGPMELLLQFGESYNYRGIPGIGIVSPVASLMQEAAIKGVGTTLQAHAPVLGWFPKHIRQAMWNP